MRDRSQRHQIEATRFVVDPPAALAAWADTLKGSRVGEKIVAGWGWDGRSPGVELILAPKGRRYIDAPQEVWCRSQR